jgi:aminoglycoside 3-N-acetyltransferase I
MRCVRLNPGDRARAHALFALMSEVFEEEARALGDERVDLLLGREDFWALIALEGNEVVGGLTAHTLPMTRAESFEVFIYDLAVRRNHQRQGVGRALVAHLRATAAALGIHDVFVAADDDDTHALDFYRAIGGVGAPVTIFSFTRGRTS